MSVERPMGILQRSADLVELLARRGPLSPADIAESVDTPRSSVYRLADALAEVRLTDQLDDSRVRLNLRWLGLADAARAAMSEWAGARRILDELAGSTHQTVFLSVPRGHTSVCIDWARGEAINVLLLKPGRSLPLHAGAAGRVTLAFGVEDLESFVSGAPFERFTDRTITTATRLRRDVASTRKQGYVISDCDVTDGIGAIGAPLRWTTTGGFAGALSVAGLAEEFRDRQQEFTDKLLAAAAALSTTLP